MHDAVNQGMLYLGKTQEPDGSWVPLWFGNQGAPLKQNPVLGTARVLEAYAELGTAGEPAAKAGVRYLLHAQNSDGSWGGAPGLPASVEETAMAVAGLAAAGNDADAREACFRGAECLVSNVLSGALDRPAPIGLYFARLWYSERLYPVIWTVHAMERVAAVFHGGP
jgi:squalene-hopene/tetraprenyl-beta-curcumene cyclase